jgi:hypothetical protein
MRDLGNEYKILYRKPARHKQFGRPRDTLKNIIKSVTHMSFKNVGLLDMGPARTSFGDFENMVVNLQVILKKEGRFS